MIIKPLRAAGIELLMLTASIGVLVFGWYQGHSVAVNIQAHDVIGRAVQDVSVNAPTTSKYDTAGCVSALVDYCGSAGFSFSPRGSIDKYQASALKHGWADMGPVPNPVGPRSRQFQKTDPAGVHVCILIDESDGQIQVEIDVSPCRPEVNWGVEHPSVSWTPLDPAVPTRFRLVGGELFADSAKLSLDFEMAGVNNGFGIKEYSESQAAKDNKLTDLAIPVGQKPCASSKPVTQSCPIFLVTLKGTRVYRLVSSTVSYPYYEALISDTHIWMADTAATLTQAEIRQIFDSLTPTTNLGLRQRYPGKLRPQF